MRSLFTPKAGSKPRLGTKIRKPCSKSAVFGRRAIQWKATLFLYGRGDGRQQPDEAHPRIGDDIAVVARSMGGRPDRYESRQKLLELLTRWVFPCRADQRSRVGIARILEFLDQSRGDLIYEGRRIGPAADRERPAEILQASDQRGCADAYEAITSSRGSTTRLRSAGNDVPNQSLHPSRSRAIQKRNHPTSRNAGIS
jgi:hypothetical protein